MSLAFRPLATLPEVIVSSPVVRRDPRGSFAETYKASEFRAAGLPTNWVQQNHAHSVRRGTLRGLHFQNPPKAQHKLVQCIAGRIQDVVVDLRKGSPTYCRWEAVELDARKPEALLVPAGFGHGLCTLDDATTVQYWVSEEYDATLDRSIRFDDPDLAIRWPVSSPILSEKDVNAPLLRDADCAFVWSRR